MNKETLRGQWHQLEGRIRGQWGNLADGDLDQARGDAEMLAGRIQERYGRTKEEAQRELNRFLEACDARVTRASIAVMRRVREAARAHRSVERR